MDDSDRFDHQDWKTVTIKKRYTKEDKKKLVKAGKGTVQKKTDKDSNIRKIKLDNDTENTKHEKINQNFSKQMMQARLTNKITQDQLAKKLNLPKSTIVSYENGKAIPKPQEIAKIRRSLKM